MKSVFPSLKHGTAALFLLACICFSGLFSEAGNESATLFPEDGVCSLQPSQAESDQIFADLSPFDFGSSNPDLCGRPSYRSIRIQGNYICTPLSGTTPASCDRNLFLYKTSTDYLRLVCPPELRSRDFYLYSLSKLII